MVITSSSRQFWNLPGKIHKGHLLQAWEVTEKVLTWSLGRESLQFSVPTCPSFVRLFLYLYWPSHVWNIGHWTVFLLWLLNRLTVWGPNVCFKSWTVERAFSLGAWFSKNSACLKSIWFFGGYLLFALLSPLHLSMCCPVPVESNCILSGVQLGLANW